MYKTTINDSTDLLDNIKSTIDYSKFGKIRGILNKDPNQLSIYQKLILDTYLSVLCKEIEDFLNMNIVVKKDIKYACNIIEDLIEIIKSQNSKYHKPAINSINRLMAHINPNISSLLKSYKYQLYHKNNTNFNINIINPLFCQPTVIYKDFSQNVDIII